MSLRCFRFLTNRLMRAVFHRQAVLLAHWMSVLLCLIVWLPLPAASQDRGIVCILYQAAGNTEIGVLDTNSGAIRQLTDNGVLNYDPTWSPDGTQIAFASRMDVGGLNLFDVFIMDVDGQRPVNLTSTPDADDRMPTWSPDGKHLAFVSGREDSNWEIYVMDANGANVRRLTYSPNTDRLPAWSPDGEWIAYDSYDSSKPSPSHIYLMRPDGTDQMKLTEDGGGETPAWSPNGRRIAFVSSRDGNRDIFVMNADGRNAINLTKGVGQNSSPTWSPSGKYIAFFESLRGTVSIVADTGEDISWLVWAPDFIAGQLDWYKPPFAIDGVKWLGTSWGAVKQP